MKIKILNISVLGLFAYLLSGCIYDDLSQCPTKIRFSYTLNPSGENLFGSTVDEINVYIFDQNNRFIRSYSDSGILVSNDYILQLPVENNPISVVAIGGDLKNNYSIGKIRNNDFDQNLIVGETTLHDFRVKLKHDPIIANNPNALLIGNITNLKSDRKLPYYTIEMTNNLNQINVQISGLSHIDYTPIISAVNARYDYNNTIPTDAKIRYYQPNNDTRLNSNNFTFHTLRLMYDSQIMLNLYDSNGENALDGFEGLNLMELIKKSPNYSSQIELDRETIYNLQLNFEGSTIVSMIINGWEVIVTKPEA